jgi:hypothetical protein
MELRKLKSYNSSQITIRYLKRTWLASLQLGKAIGHLARTIGTKDADV